jgi:D-alanyl-D-alanine carboxypeptidase
VKRRFALRTITSPGLLPVLLVFLSLFASVAPAAAAEKYAAIVVDGNTGKTLYAKYADAQRYPASLTKMMTLYVLFEELKAKRMTLSTPLSVSANAASQAPSKLGVRAGRTIEVEDAILALTTKSANDVAVVVAENVSGSVSQFAKRMNKTARALGMNSTRFRNPHGLPDSGQVTTARDLTKLARALQDRFPTYYKYFGARTFTYKGVRHRNHNRLLGSVEGVDGIKTGYIRASGFNLVTNVKRDGRHIIAVVMGGKTASSRDAQMRQLIADYLPAAKRGRRTAPLLIADYEGADDGEEVETASEDDLIAEAEVALARLPRARPDLASSALGYAAAEPHRDIVAAAMATATAEEPEAEPAPAAVEAAPVEPAAADPITARIEVATQVAELAYAPTSNASAERLTEIAQERAERRDVIASAPPAHADQDDADAPSDSGWQIQVGAVPTREGARALLEKAKASMGDMLAERQPLTIEIERNGTTLYRARFAGFSDKEAARSACNQLKSKSLACLAVPS